MSDTSMAHARTSSKCEAEFPTEPKCSLFDLPPEIRDMIYHWLWISTPDILLSVGRKHGTLRPSWKTIRLMYGAEKASHLNGLPMWLLTNQSVLADGLGQLRLHQRHVMDETDIKRLSEIGASFNFLAGAPAATRLSVIGDGYKYMDLLDSEKAVSIYAVSENSQSTFETAQMTNLKALEINLVVAYPHECLSKKQSIDLSFFEAKNVHLERLVVEIVAETFDIYPDNVVESVTNIRKLALAEVTRLGQLLVGNGAVVEVHDGANNNNIRADYQWSMVVYRV